jgi:hypothetical protein
MLCLANFAQLAAVGEDIAQVSDTVMTESVDQCMGNYSAVVRGEYVVLKLASKI